MQKELPDQISESKPIAAHEDQEQPKLRERGAEKDKPHEKDTPETKEEREEKLDETLEDSFPASDPPAFNKTTAGG